MSTDRRELLKTLHQMVFVYNAVLDGWTVRKARDNKFKFSKKRSNNTERYSIDNNVDDNSPRFESERELLNFIKKNSSTRRFSQ